MKKFLMIVAMCCLTMATAQAQEVFKELLKSAKEIAEDKSKDIETRKIATFKFDELSYMAMKVRDDVLRDTTDLEFFNRYCWTYERISSISGVKNRETF